MIKTSTLAAAAAAALMVGGAAALLIGGNPAAAAPSVAPAPAAPPGVPVRGVPFPAGQTIVVDGRGVVEAAPDRAFVTVGAEVTRPSAQEAQERASSAMAQVLQRVMALGISRERIQTVEVNLVPERRQDGVVTGYQATQRARITVDDLALVGRVLDAAAAGGANLLDGVSFTIRDAAPYRTQAFTAAVQDARATANALAAASGLTIARIERIEELGTNLPVTRGFAAPAAPLAMTPVQPGTLSVTAQVRVIFGF